MTAARGDMRAMVNGLGWSWFLGHGGTLSIIRTAVRPGASSGTFPTVWVMTARQWVYSSYNCAFFGGISFAQRSLGRCPPSPWPYLG